MPIESVSMSCYDVGKNAAPFSTQHVPAHVIMHSIITTLSWTTTSHICTCDGEIGIAWRDGHFHCARSPGHIDSFIHMRSQPHGTTVKARFRPCLEGLVPQPWRPTAVAIQLPSSLTLALQLTEKINSTNSTTEIYLDHLPSFHYLSCSKLLMIQSRSFQ